MSAPIRPYEMAQYIEQEDEKKYIDPIIPEFTRYDYYKDVKNFVGNDIFNHILAPQQNLVLDPPIIPMIPAFHPLENELPISDTYEDTSLLEANAVGDDDYMLSTKLFRSAPNSTRVYQEDPLRSAESYRYASSGINYFSPYNRYRIVTEEMKLNVIESLPEMNEALQGFLPYNLERNQQYNLIDDRVQNEIISGNAIDDGLRFREISYSINETNPPRITDIGWSERYSDAQRSMTWDLNWNFPSQGFMRTTVDNINWQGFTHPAEAMIFRYNHF